jgi:ketosteroid isomerase-like protein
MDMKKIEHNISIVRRFYDAARKGDFAAAAALATPEVLIEIPGRAWYSGKSHGMETLIGNANQMYQMTDNTLEADLYDVCASEEHAVGLHIHRARRNGKVLEMRNASIFSIKNGKINGVREHIHELYETDEFYAR